MGEPADALTAIARAIESNGWAVQDAFIDTEIARVLRADAFARYTQGEFKPAAVGTGRQRAVRPDVRSDEIHWITEARAPALRAACERFEALRLTLNRELALGLFEHEIHYARYGPGAFYSRHVDRFSGDADRVLSTALYLNEAWTSQDGGALRLHFDGDSAPRTHDILPAAGRLVIFLSDEFAHEVLPASRDRFSLTGWFRRR